MGIVPSSASTCKIFLCIYLSCIRVASPSRIKNFFVLLFDAINVSLFLYSLPEKGKNVIEVFFQQNV